MSAAGAEVPYPRTGVGARLARTARAGTLPVRALLASRLIVLVAGVAGALLLPRRIDWQGFDPSHLTSRLGGLGDVLAAPAVRWDSIHYLAIAQHGYARPGDAVFFPLYPLLIRGFGFLIGSDPLAGVLISAGCLAVALTVLHRLTELELGWRAADAAVLLVAFAPLSFFFTAVYTESLFLALSLGCLYAARRERWRLAAVLGALAAVARVTGVVLAVPLAIMRLREARRLNLVGGVPRVPSGANDGLSRFHRREGIWGARARDSADRRHASARPHRTARYDRPRRPGGVLQECARSRRSHPMSRRWAGRSRAEPRASCS